MMSILATEEVSWLCAALERLDPESTREVVRWLASCETCTLDCPVRPQTPSERAEMKRRAQPPPVQ